MMLEIEPGPPDVLLFCLNEFIHDNQDCAEMSVLELTGNIPGAHVVFFPVMILLFSFLFHMDFRQVDLAS